MPSRASARRRLAVSPEPDTFDQASLERFQTELIEAGFEPGPGWRRVWTGPIADALKPLTTAETMKIVFLDGWPFQHPRLFVEGLDAEHVGSDGQVCLWREGASSDEWRTFADFLKRIDEWATRAQSGFQSEDFALDGHLSFEARRSGCIATVDLSALPMDGAEGKLGKISGTWDKNETVLKVEAGTKGTIEGRWYLLADPPRRRPHDIAEVRQLLNKRQRPNLERRLGAVDKHGHSRLLLIAWDRELGREALVLLVEPIEHVTTVRAIEVAPIDEQVLKLRAGPDVEALAGKRVCIFGIGAIGSHAALTLAECGTGILVLVDRDRLRPGNVVRHAANSLCVGYTKVHAISLEALTRASWTRVVTEESSPWGPTALRALLGGADLVIDTTGLSSFTRMIASVCQEEDLPLVSAALYRQGAVGRVRRQALPSDVPLWEREPPRYPVIPSGEEPPPIFEAGCSAAVNNASPLVVKSISALLAESAIDLLTGRLLLGDERLVVYRPLKETPFNRIGPVAT